MSRPLPRGGTRLLAATAVAAPVLDALGRQATSLTATGALLLAALLGRR
ncbi:hypothetical protein [Streptomyces sp. Ag109_O5-10]|nr:hypothetical protein [Streptomyces sp. Ag109_O5-10]SEE01230.1 hypothetical protein SAMN05216533_1163 [Streptomyces sp. Ag109_O5-10]